MFSGSISFFPFLSFCVFFWFGYLLVHRASPWLHSAAMPIASSYTPEQCQHHLLTLTTVFCCSCLGGRCCSRLEPAYQFWIVGQVTYSLPLGRTISSPLLFKIKKISLSLSRSLQFSLSSRLSNMLLSKKKTVLQSHNLWPDRFLSIKLDCEGEREGETDREFQNVSLPPLQHEASVVDKTIQTERERERWHKRLQA